MKKNVVLITVILLVIAVFAGSCASSGGSNQRAEPVIKYRWNFDDAAGGTGGWALAPDEYWDFHGTVSLSRDDKTFGKAMLRWDIDYTQDTSSEWSEPKMFMTFDTPIEGGVRRIVFDIIYKPELATGGHFKSKVIFRNDKKQLSENLTDAIIAKEEIGNGYVKETVRISARTTQPLNGILLSIAAYHSDYKGPIFFDNMYLEL